MWGGGSWRPAAVEGEAVRGAWRRTYLPFLLLHRLGSHPALGGGDGPCPCLPNLSFQGARSLSTQGQTLGTTAPPNGVLARGVGCR